MASPRGCVLNPSDDNDFKEEQESLVKSHMKYEHYALDKCPENMMNNGYLS
jgi:predicted small metal-binding protein